ncbi:Eco57I restriction-modification methylase domain-containing protein [Capnocytophaga canimorsus]|uniref:Eco57I restriction-modification methylase domain-containing protein n=1 Tax=Capnocytophaga canimorsus TaxID=28188 RepID=UPI00385D4236
MNYNPDVLTCLANLSNDEVFTPPDIANQMLDTLPQELFSNPNAKFLDPFSKSGVFLREIAKRLLKGLETQFPDLQKRIDHIMHRQLYGIGITELTAYLSRRSLYCSTRANGKHSVTHFENENGNIYFKELPHSWDRKGKCTYCGATQKEFGEDQREGLSLHSYNFIHNDNPFENMQFDVIIGNPPYQMSDGGGTGDSAKPIYHLFIQQAIKLNPHYLCMIVPSRWMKGGKGLEEFRKNMMKDKRIKCIHDFESANEIFPGIKLDGGVCYFLWDRDYNGKCYFEYTTLEKEVIKSERDLKTEISDTVIRDFRQISIIQKAQQFKEKRFSEIVSSRKPFGFDADFFNKPERYPDIRIEKDSQPHLCKIYGVKGKKGGAKRVVGYINRKHIHKAAKSIDKYKLFFSKAYTTTATVPPEIIVGENNTICTETFLKIGDFNIKQEALNCLSYIKTKFFRALLFFNRHSLNISQESFVLAPMQDFSKPWTDAELYAKYGLTQEEIAYIEKMVRPME